MKVEYDAQTDTLTITLREARIRESDEVRPGVIADFGYDGGVVRFEVLDASKVVDRTREMQFALAGEALTGERQISPGGKTLGARRRRAVSGRRRRRR